MPDEGMAPYWVVRVTDRRVVAEAADYEAARQALWLCWQRGWPVEIRRNPLTIPVAEPEEGRASRGDGGAGR